MILEVRHDVGGSCLMALSLNNSARHWMPAGPKCFSRCSGIELKPELLSALKCLSSTAVISCGVMWWAIGLARGANSSGVMVAS